MAAKFRYKVDVGSNGKVEKIHGIRGFNQDLALFAGKSVYFEFGKWTKPRSNKQSNYYWAVVVPSVTDFLSEAGYERYKLTLEVVHEFLKEKFLKEDVINELDGEVLQIPRSTTDLSTTDMMTYIDDISRWCLEFFGCTFPAPNEQGEFNF